MGIVSVLLIITVAVAFVLFPVYSKQDYKLDNFSSTDLSQINQNDDGFSGTQILDAGKCSKAAISIAQMQTGLSYNGIPIFTVQIINMCGSECDISDIHLSCGAFSSVTLINPMVFKRLKINDCLVNGGRPLKHGSVISFTYQTSFIYPLSVASVGC